MAVSLTLTSATPYALKYEYVYDGAGGGGSGTVSRTQAQMVADLAALNSPLRRLLESIAVDATWDDLDESPEVSLYTTINNLPAGTSLATEFLVVGADRAIRVVGVDGNAARAMIEIRFHHSFDR